ncbi:sensor histidine kinase [Bacillus sp. REN16]|uniref:sensor histidine kinase n=1 Tax=Bacillus sp. REN16 TaxID=2887296 RepID=UPI001E453CC9|nr:HAMP domain-containing sensor histidine kinase [Bacillus sp. REN16]MCC3355846.1 HAMP domain-containing histidine kinase [Bacillus sp. REN16]
MKLRKKINLFTAVVFIILLVLVNIASYFTFSQMMFNGELDRTEAEAERAMNGISQTGNSVSAATLLRTYLPLDGMMQVVRPDGSVAAQAFVPEQQALENFPTAYHKAKQRQIIDFNGVPHAFVSYPIIWLNGDVVELQVIENLSSTSNNLKTLSLVLLAVTLIATIPVFVSTRLLSNVITQPITKMIQTMREIRKSGQYKRIELSKESNDELYEMGHTFNEMMDLLEVNYEKQENFVSNASHELKTPLTVIDSYASLLKRRGQADPKLFHEAVDAIQSEAIHMRELTQQLLLLAKHDEQWKLYIEPVSLLQLVDESVVSFREAYKREISIIAEEEIIVRTDKQKLKQLFYILMENALKYSEKPVIVVLGQERKRPSIKIIDQGVGIPAQDVEKVFDRFYRVDKARARKTGGYGLGLSLAKELADAIHAQVQLESIEGEGTTANILLTNGASH